MSSPDEIDIQKWLKVESMSLGAVLAEKESLLQWAAEAEGKDYESLQERYNLTLNSYQDLLSTSQQTGSPVWSKANKAIETWNHDKEGFEDSVSPQSLNQASTLKEYVRLNTEHGRKVLDEVERAGGASLESQLAEKIALGFVSDVSDEEEGDPAPALLKNTTTNASKEKKRLDEMVWDGESMKTLKGCVTDALTGLAEDESEDSANGDGEEYTAKLP